MRFDGRLLRQIAALKLPHPHHFVLNSSGALAERGVISVDEVGDIDGSTCATNHAHLKTLSGWKTEEIVVGETDSGAPVTITVTHDAARRFDINYYDFCAYEYAQTGKGRIFLKEQLRASEQDPETKLWVATIDYVARVKRSTGRAKDIARLQAIAQFRQRLP